MKPTSRKHLAAAEEWISSALEPISARRNGVEKSIDIANEFFVLSDALTSSAQLRALLADPMGSDEAKIRTINQLMGTANPAVLEIVKKLTAFKWGSDSDYQECIEQIGREALLLAAVKAGDLEEVETQVFHLVHQLRRNPDAVPMLADLKVHEQQRAGVLRTLLEQKPNPIATLLTERAAIEPGSYLEHLTALGNLIAGRRRLTVAEVTSAVELSKAQTERLERILSAKYGKAIQVVTQIDPDIIGGLRIEIGPYVIDDTIRARLAEVERRLA